MTFADELKKGTYSKPEPQPSDYQIKMMAERMISGIRSACERASKQGQSSISGYLQPYSDEGYLGYSVKPLPVVDDYYRKASEFNSERYYADGGIRSVSEGTSEFHINRAYMVASDHTNAERIKKQLEKMIDDLGFTDYSIKIEKLDDVIVREVVKASFFTRKATKTVSTTRGNEAIYALRININW